MGEKRSEESGEEKKGGKMKLVVIAVVVLVLGGGGAWFFLFKGSGKAEAAEPEPGEVVRMESIQVNLADNHYLKIGIALQATADATAHGEIDGSKAQDHTIDIFSGQSMEALGQRKVRTKLKKELEHKLEEAYHGDVMGVYFHDFVTQ